MKAKSRGSITGWRGAFALRVAMMAGLAVGVTSGTAFAGAPDSPTSLRVGGVVVAPRDDKSATISFNISKAETYRHEGNHNAVWVFFKARPEGSSEWQPVRLAADKVMNPTGYGQGKGGHPMDLIVPDGEDGYTGLIVRRADYGYGKVAASNVVVVWDLAAAKGIAKDTKAEVRVFGIDLVFIPEGAYVLGGGTMPNHFYLYTNETESTLSYPVKGPGAIPTGRQPGKLWASMGAQPEDKGEIPATFPNGYAAAYCMEKTITSDNFVGFLNTLPPALAEKFCPPGEGAAMRHLTRSGTGTNVTYGTNADGNGRINMGKLSWEEGATFAAWAGLRPMTELEYEKITRGPRLPGVEAEEWLDHPSYWQVTDMNGWRKPTERTVTVANATGRRFKGTHGMGLPVLPADWPQADAVGVGIRGGFGKRGDPAYRLTADKVDAERNGYYWRGMRTAPKGVGL